ncbi:MAG: flagellar biosynthetic protein FliR, partial [Cupriavidus sp.]|nr:flagellar biosynthetic protein FliR [Cupriavidus sp.]
MFEVTTDQMYGWIAAFLWPMFRLMALIATAPLFSESTIPRRAKILLAAALATIVSPTIGNIPTAPVYSYEGLLVVM